MISGPPTYQNYPQNWTLLQIHMQGNINTNSFKSELWKPLDKIKMYMTHLAGLVQLLEYLGQLIEV